MPHEITSSRLNRTNGAHPSSTATPSIAIAARPNTPAVVESTAETPSSMVGALHTAFGNHHARAVHAKGVILKGTFTPTLQAREISKALVFASGTLPVTVRFSDFTGIPDIPDTTGDANPRGFAVKFHLPSNCELDLVTHSFNGFPTRTSDEFAQLLRAIGHSGADAQKPTELDRFLASHPIAKTFLTPQKPAPVSFGTLSYYGVNAFAFVDAQQHRRSVRYRLIPAAGEQFLDPVALKSKSPDYLMEEIRARVAVAPIVFNWYAQVAQAGDREDDPSVAWPESRTLIELGSLGLTFIDSTQPSSDKTLLFLPGRLPAGIEVADPMVAIRNAAYPISFDERQ